MARGLWVCSSRHCVGPSRGWPLSGPRRTAAGSLRVARWMEGWTDSQAVHLCVERQQNDLRNAIWNFRKHCDQMFSWTRGSLHFAQPRHSRKIFTRQVSKCPLLKQRSPQKKGGKWFPKASVSVCQFSVSVRVLIKGCNVILLKGRIYFSCVKQTSCWRIPRELEITTQPMPYWEKIHRITSLHQSKTKTNERCPRLCYVCEVGCLWTKLWHFITHYVCRPVIVGKKVQCCSMGFVCVYWTKLSNWYTKLHTVAKMGYALCQ